MNKHEWSLIDDSWAAASLKSHLGLGTQAASLEGSAHLQAALQVGESPLPSNCFYSRGEQIEAFLYKGCSNSEEIIAQQHESF